MSCAPILTVDTVAWSLPLNAVDAASLPRDHRRRHWDSLDGGLRSVSDTTTLPSGVRVTLLHGSGRIRFEGSIAKAVQGHNISCLPWDDALMAMRRVERDVAALFPRSISEQDRELHRLDIVRDFQPVPEAAQILRGLALDPSYRRTSMERYKESRGGRAGSLVRGPASARATLYDKDAESRRYLRRVSGEEAVEAGRLAHLRLRYELRLRPASLTQMGFAKVHQVDPAAVSIEAQRRFQMCQFDATVATGDLLLDKVDALGLSAREANSLRGFLMAEWAGRPSGLSVNTVDKYRRIVREAQLVRSDWGGRARALRLDYETGQQVEA